MSSHTVFARSPGGQLLNRRRRLVSSSNNQGLRQPPTVRRRRTSCPASLEPRRFPVRRTRLSAERLELRDTPTTLPAGFIESPFVSGINRPTAMVLAPDGRSFVAQQGGQLRVVRDGQLLDTPFVSLTVDSNGERGLLGVALDPSFATNNFI